MPPTIKKLSITALKMQRPLRFTFIYAQAVTQRYKQRTVLEMSLQSIQYTDNSRLQMCCREAMHRIDTLGCQQKEMGHKGGKR